MKKFVLLIFLSVVICSCVFADQKKTEPSQLFYTANNLYEKRDYDGAVKQYLQILEMGLQSPNLYYDIGNTYFKKGEVGYAILFYERAKRMMPQDGDLKSNLSYAKSLVGNPSFQLPRGNVVISLIKTPFGDFNINAIALACLFFYITLIALLAIYIANPVVGKRLRLLIIVWFLLFGISTIALSLRYYDERIVKTGVVVEKTAECKYEPIDKSTTFYKLLEGDEVIVLKTRSGWRQIKRADGKIGWVKASAVEII